MSQWTIDPSDIQNGKVSADVGSKALAVYDARVIVHHGHVQLVNGDCIDGFGVPSWTDADTDEDYVVNVTTHPDGTREVDCSCPATGPCHHGLAALLVLDQLDRERQRPALTVIPGGRA
jgi:hypothetical protein